MTAPQPNIALINKVIEQIDAHPETWDQSWWAHKTECGTSHCFAGWACVLAGEKILWGKHYHGSCHVDDEDMSLIEFKARELLGLGCIEVGRLFDRDNTREDIQELVDKIIARTGVIQD